eukprot:TRINITY_DN69536_c0_g1_i1.p1 TRINITY_DN69536_c0_g1~~TRINITY_DN69536_c0_g1_i1.p1  ORF type:complete len:106 (-),score=5.47 TRINITY_DN69536_c0_g1_i1:228-545(-)
MQRAIAFCCLVVVGVITLSSHIDKFTFNNYVNGVRTVKSCNGAGCNPEVDGHPLPFEDGIKNIDIDVNCGKTTLKVDGKVMEGYGSASKAHKVLAKSHHLRGATL